MDKLQLDRLRKRLDRHRKQICGALIQLHEEQKEAEAYNDWKTHVTGETRQKLLGRLAAWYLKEVALIDKALSRIDSQVYGLCVACGQTIEPARLATFPQSEFCNCCHYGAATVQNPFLTHT